MIHLKKSKAAVLCLGLSLSFMNLVTCQKPEISFKPSQLAVATFAGGCFWCLEEPFESLPGVAEVISGYTGGNVVNPGYQQVSVGNTGHVEAVQVYFHPEKISYRELLETFWMQIDPTDGEGQFGDRGSQYRTVIFYHNNEQKESAERSKQKLIKSAYFKKAIVTEVKPAGFFYRAEEEHQNFYIKNSPYYKLYRSDSGRDRFINLTWGAVNIWKD